MIYYCCANQENIGDYFSLLGNRDLFGLPGTNIFMSGNVRLFEDRLSKLTGSDVLIVGGGGLLKDHFSKYWRAIFNQQNKLGFKLLSMGIGVCDIKNKNTIISRQILKEIELRSLALYVRPAIPDGLVSAKESYCPSNFYFSKFKKNVESEMLLYVEHPKLIGEANNLKIKAEINKYCEEHSLEFKVINNTVTDFNYSSIFDIYNSSSVIVSTRLHGLVLGHAVDKRVIAISNDFKIDAYCKKIGSKNLVALKGFSHDSLGFAINDYKAPVVSSGEINKSLVSNLKGCQDIIGGFCS